MSPKEIEDFIQNNKMKIRWAFQKNPEENLCAIFLECADRNLDTISKWKGECEHATAEGKIELEGLIKRLMKFVDNSLSVVPL